MRRARGGYTLIELMITVVIVSLLATLSVNEFDAQVKYAKRTEAIVGLGALWRAQRAYFQAHGTYAGSFQQLDWSIEGGQAQSATRYTGKRYTYQLSQPWGPGSFYCVGTAQLDADVFPDILEVFEDGR